MLEGVEKYTIEHFAERLPQNDLKQGFFVDCGLTWDNPITITDITAADPVVVTAAGHGFSDGDRVRITDVRGMTELNDYWFLASNTTANTLELQNLSSEDVDGTGFSAYLSAGIIRKGVDTITGLQHLYGKDIAILADGNVQTNFTLEADGTLTLQRKYSVVHVGLPYVSDLETMAIDPQNAPGTTTSSIERPSTTRS